MFLELCLFVAFMAFLRTYVFKSRAERLYEKIPGPKSYPIIGNVLEFDYPRVEITETIKALSFKYGPVYLLRLGRDPTVCLRNPADVEIALGSTTELEKASLYWPLSQWLNQGLLTSKPDIWKRHRKIITPAFHFKILESFVPIFVKNAHILVEKLSGITGKEFDVTRYIDLCLLDAITETAMGIEVYAQSQESKYVSAINEVVEIISNRNFDVIQRSPLFHLLPVGRKHDKLVSFLHGFTESVIKERKNKLLQETKEKEDINTQHKDIGIKEKKVFLDLLLEYSMGGNGLTDTEIREEVDTFMFEGYDTTSTTVSFCLYCLSQNKDVQNKAYEEIHSILGDSDRDPTYEDLKEMKYLEKVIMETLRVYTTIVFVGRKLNNDMVLKSGYVLPANSSILLLIQAMCQDPAIFPDPHIFDPTRFDKRQDNPYTFVPFSAGPRNCIGQKYAYLEMKTVISLILRKFRLLPSNVSIIPKFSIVLRSNTGVRLTLEHP